MLLNETIELLMPRPEGFWVDATGGGGGHSREILKRIVPGGKLIIFDRDSEALAQCEKALSDFDGYVIFMNENFADMAPALSSVNINKVSGVLFDLGVSSHQIDEPQRGFSFMKDGPLDMRMDKGLKTDAGRLLNELDERTLADIIFRYGEERFARKIAWNIVRVRPMTSTADLLKAVEISVPRQSRISSCARVFQAVRIAVNDELESLRKGLEGSLEHLEKGGRLVVISYHSLEDRMVKGFMRTAAAGCVCDRKAPVCVCGKEKTLKIITKKPLVSGPDETEKNPRSRSAKLRAAERI